MSHERAVAHASTAASDNDVDRDELVPGRVSRSALLRKPDHAIISGLLARKARDANGVADGAEHAVATASSSSGQPLPEMLMRKFESSLGADLSGVRVHTGSESAAANDAVGARAYTLGSDIHFGANQYDPSSGAGEHLLAHEVAHTVQQGGGAQRMQFKLDVSSPGDALEHEADRAADAMVAGAAASVSMGSGVQRVQREKLPPSKTDNASASFTLKEVPLLGENGMDIGYVTLKASLSGAVSAAAHKDDKGGGGSKPIETSVSGKKDGVELGGSKELELGWTMNPKIQPGVSYDKDGLHFKVGVGIEREGWKGENWEFGDLALSITGIDWNPPKKPTCGEITGSVSGKVNGTFRGMDVALSGTLSGSAQPNWARILPKLGELAAEAVTAGLGSVAAAIALPLGVFAAGLVGWAKAGHEYDGLHGMIDNFSVQCDAVAREALTGVHRATVIAGIGDTAAGVTKAALDARKQAAAILGISEAALLAAGQHKPNLIEDVADMVWAAKWPAVQADLYKAYMLEGDRDQVRLLLNGYKRISASK
jgi:hypothetical protein